MQLVHCIEDRGVAESFIDVHHEVEDFRIRKRLHIPDTRTREWGTTSPPNIIPAAPLQKVSVLKICQVAGHSIGFAIVVHLEASLLGGGEDVVLHARILSGRVGLVVDIATLSHELGVYRFLGFFALPVRCLLHVGVVVFGKRFEVESTQRLLA